MKRIFLVLCFISTYKVSYSQSYLPLTGGTLTGQLNGTTALFSGIVTGNAAYNLVGSGSNSIGVGPFFGWNNALSGTDIRAWIKQLNASNGIDDWYYNGSTWGIKRTLSSNGNMGVGTSSPATLLHISGSSNFDTELRVEVPFGLTRSILGLSNAGTVYGELAFDNSNNDLTLMQKYPSGKLHFGTNSSPNLTIKNGGDIGIGTQNPLAKLDVRGDGASIKLSSSSDPSSYALTITNYYDAANKFAVNDGIQTVLGNKVISGVLDNQGIPFLSGYYGLMFSTGSTNPNSISDIKMVVSTSGNVGIGTTSPTEKLSVMGKIRSQEIKVETANWPDFVFEPSYKLPELHETDKFIKENKHLPGIPTAKEAEKEGINLGEMNAKLLQKIEELTLHLISQDKKLTEQNERIKLLEKGRSKRSKAL